MDILTPENTQSHLLSRRQFLKTGFGAIIAALLAGCSRNSYPKITPTPTHPIPIPTCDPACEIPSDEIATELDRSKFYVMSPEGYRATAHYYGDNTLITAKHFFNQTAPYGIYDNIYDDPILEFTDEQVSFTPIVNIEGAQDSIAVIELTDEQTAVLTQFRPEIPPLPTRQLNSPSEEQYVAVLRGNGFTPYKLTAQQEGYAIAIQAEGVCPQNLLHPGDSGTIIMGMQQLRNGIWTLDGSVVGVFSGAKDPIALNEHCTPSEGGVAIMHDEFAGTVYFLTFQ
jgi:hypothetical protein